MKYGIPNNNKIVDNTINLLLNADITHANKSVSDEEKNEMLSQFFDQIQKKVLDGYTILITKIHEFQLFNKISSSILPYLPEPDKLKKAMSSKYLIKELQVHDFAEICGFRDDAILHFYEIACTTMDDHKFLEASNAFYFLCWIKPNVPIFWLEYARCELARNNLEAACAAYRMACFLDRNSPSNYLEAIQEFLKINEISKAKILFQEAIETMKSQQENPTFKILKDYIEDPSNEYLTK